LGDNPSALASPLLAIVLAAAALGGGRSPEEIQAAARAALASETQRVLPGEATGAAPKPVDRAARRDRGRVEERSALGDLSSVALWVLGIVGVGVGLAWLVGELSGRRRGEGAVAAGAAEARAAEHAVVERPLGDADALAAEGRFDAAIHVLLLRTFEALVAERRTPLPPSLTSREIVRRVGLGAEARGALEALVGAVEVTHFGGRVPDEGDYQACREHFHGFAAAYRRTTA
jgi:hypothetical protein